MVAEKKENERNQIGTVNLETFGSRAPPAVNPWPVEETHPDFEIIKRVLKKR